MCGDRRWKCIARENYSWMQQIAQKREAMNNVVADGSDLLGLLQSDEGGKDKTLRPYRKAVIVTCVGTSALIGALLVPFVAPGWRKITLPFLPATATQVNLISSFLRRCLQNREAECLVSPVAAPLSSAVSAMTSTGSPKEAADVRRVADSKALSWNPNVRWEHQRLIDLGSGDGRLVLAAAREGMQATGKVDLGHFEVIVLFGVEGMMGSVKEKLREEMKKEALFIACRFALPACQSCVQMGSGVDTVWIYRHSDITQ